MPAGQARKRERGSQAHPFAAQLRAARHARDLSLEELALKTGYDRFTLMRWENGDNSPNLSHFIDWAGGLGFEVRLRPGASDRPVAA